MSDIVQAQGLRKEYRGPKGTRTVAVDSVSFTCGEGQVFGLLGPNGAGKTTTLRMLSTVLSPTSGTARIAGYDVVREPDRVRASIGFLSGNTGLYGRLTPREVLRYFGRLFGLDEARIRARTDELAALFGMGDFLDKRCDALSSGMKQKVNIARTVIHDPPVIFFDEPTSGLDVLTSRTIVDFVRQCRARGRCVVFSTHIMADVARLCDALCIVHNGRVQFAGSVEELRAHEDEALEDAFLRILETAA